MKHKCWDTARSWNLPERNWKGYVQQFLQEIQTSVCFFSSSSVETHPFSFCAGKSVASLPFLTYFCSSFVILPHSPAVLSTCISVVTGVKANRWTGPNDKLIRIKIVIFFPICTENYLTDCGRMCGNKIQRRGLLVLVLCGISKMWVLELNTWGCNYSRE